MRPLAYVALFLLIVPFQERVLDLVAFRGIKPDAGLAVVYALALLTGPFEAALAGVALGLLVDVGSAGFLGFSGLLHGLVGLSAGVLGRNVLDIASPANVLFLAAFALAERIAALLFLQLTAGSVPFFGLLFGRAVPLALLTGLLGYLLLRLTTRKRVLAAILRRDLVKD